MNQEEVLSGKGGVAGVQRLLNGASSRRLLKGEVQKMLREGYHVGTLRLTRAKFKPGRKLSAYFTFPVLDADDRVSHTAHLAATWQDSLDTPDSADSWSQLQEEANRSGLMPVQCELWRDVPQKGMRLQLWPFDPKFPQLVRLGSPRYVAEIFSSLGIADRTPEITPIRYRPKERHVLRYEFDSPEAVDGLKRRLYAKLYTSGQDAARAFGVASRVVDWLEFNRVGLQGNRPEALSQEDAVIFYPHAEGIPLSRQLHRSRRWLAKQLHVIGRGLATLHNGPEALQSDLKQNDFPKEAKVVRRASEHMQILLPDTYQKILDTVDRAEERYSALPQEQPTFTHADFKSDHLLTTPQGVTLIDFDTCTLTDPALDLGKFLADLEWWFTLRGLSGVEEAQAELLKAYSVEEESHQALHKRLERAKLFHVLIFVKIVARRVPIYEKDWAARTAQLIERASQVLDKALKA
jgi:Ser/Thr protein kinase RdoA (MazF antagonist)